MRKAGSAFVILRVARYLIIFHVVYATTKAVSRVCPKCRAQITLSSVFLNVLTWIKMPQRSFYLCLSLLIYRLTKMTVSAVCFIATARVFKQLSCLYQNTTHPVCFQVYYPYHNLKNQHKLVWDADICAVFTPRKRSTLQWSYNYVHLICYDVASAI